MGWVVNTASRPLYTRNGPVGARGGLEGSGKFRVEWDSIPGLTRPMYLKSLKMSLTVYIYLFHTVPSG